MLNVYEINGSFQRHCVVATDITTAEKLWKNKYGPIEIKRVELLSSYVLVEGIHDKK